MNIRVDAYGFDDAIRILDTVSTSIQVKILRDMFKKSGKKLIDDARQRVTAHNPNHANLAKAIGFINVRGAKNPIVIIGIRAKGQFKNVGFYGHWIEYGVAGIKTGSSNAIEKKSGDDSFRMWVAMVPKGSAYRHNMPAQPFMRPAIDANRGSIMNNIVLDLQTRVHDETEKAVKKNRGGYAAAKNRD